MFACTVASPVCGMLVGCVVAVRCLLFNQHVKLPCKPPPDLTHKLGVPCTRWFDCDADLLAFPVFRLSFAALQLHFNMASSATTAAANAKKAYVSLHHCVVINQLVLTYLTLTLLAACCACPSASLLWLLVLFSEGNTYFKARDYAKAIELYTEVRVWSVWSVCVPGCQIVQKLWCSLTDARAMLCHTATTAPSAQAVNLDPENHVFYSNRRYRRVCVTLACVRVRGACRERVVKARARLWSM